MRFDRRKTYPGLGQIDAYDSDTDRLVRTTIIPHRVGGVIKSPGRQTFPINVMQRFMGSRRWKFAAGRMTHGGASPFFGSKWTGVDAQIVIAASPIPFVNNLFIDFNQNIGAGIKSSWEVYIDGVKDTVTGAQLQTNTSGAKVILNIGFAATLAGGEVIEVSHIVAGEGIPIITKYPVINGH